MDIEVQTLKAKVKALEKTIKKKDKTLRATKRVLKDKNKKLKNALAALKRQRCLNKKLIGLQNQSNLQANIVTTLMENPGLKTVADKIFGYLNTQSFVNCRLVCRDWKNYIDNEYSMLQMLIQHLKWYRTGYDTDNSYDSDHYILQDHVFSWTKLVEYIEKVNDKKELRLFIKFATKIIWCYNRGVDTDFLYNPYGYLVKNHQHDILEMVLKSPMDVKLCHEWKSLDEFQLKNMQNIVFNRACKSGCGTCLKLFLDHLEEKNIDFNFQRKKTVTRYRKYQYEHCLHAVPKIGDSFIVLLRYAKEKGVDFKTLGKAKEGWTLAEYLFYDDILIFSESQGEYANETLEILRDIVPEGYAKRRQIRSAYDQELENRVRKFIDSCE